MITAQVIEEARETLEAQLAAQSIRDNEPGALMAQIKSSLAQRERARTAHYVESAALRKLYHYCQRNTQDAVLTCLLGGALAASEETEKALSEWTAS